MRFCSEFSEWEDHLRAYHPVAQPEGRMVEEPEESESGHVSTEEVLDAEINDDVTGAFTRLRLDGLL